MCLSGINVHCNGFHGWSNERDFQERCWYSGHSSGSSGVFPFPILLSPMLTNSDINIRGNGNQLVKGTDRMSSVNELVFDASGEMLVESISEVS